MHFQDIQRGAQFIANAKPGRYVHVGDLITEIDYLADRAAALGDTPQEKQACGLAADAIRAVAAQIALTSATAS